MNQQDHPVTGWVADHPAIGWAVNIALWLTDGMSPLAVLVALATLWWTVEKARTERAKRRAIDGFALTQPGALRKLWGRTTGPGDLDES